MLKAMKEAQIKAVEMIARTSLKKATTSNFPTDSEAEKVRDKVSTVQRKPVEKRSGLFVVLNTNKKRDFRPRRLHICCVICRIKRYWEQQSSSKDVIKRGDASKNGRDYLKHLLEIFVSEGIVLRSPNAPY